VDGKMERFPALARELVSLKPDVIVAANTPAARAVGQATPAIPIVVSVMGDPVGDGLVDSLARPGGNITGLTFIGPELAPKRLALLKEALPFVSRIAALFHPGAYSERTMTDMAKETEAAARTVGVELRRTRPGRPKDSSAPSSIPMMEGPECRFRREARARGRHRHYQVDGLKALDPIRPIREADI
jgi:putative ABC transport system substrate-binding protein